MNEEPDRTLSHSAVEPYTERGRSLKCYIVRIYLFLLYFICRIFVLRSTKRIQS